MPEGRGATRTRLTTLQRAELLQRVEIFSEALVEDLYRMASLAHEVEFAAGQVIFEKDDVGESFYVIIAGRAVCGRGEGQPEIAAGPGQAVGLYSVLTREPRPSAARAVEDTLALAVGAEDFYNLISCNTETVVGLMRYFLKKMGGIS
jgi:CRP-like cAMP-binding protein